MVTGWPEPNEDRDMSDFTIIETLHAVRVVQRTSDAKYGIQELIDGEPQEPRFRYGVLDHAMKIAKSISDENIRCGNN